MIYQIFQGEIIQSDRLEVTVGGADDAMADLVDGTTELAVTDGQGDAGVFPFLLILFVNFPKRVCKE